MCNNTEVLISDSWFYLICIIGANSTSVTQLVTNKLNNQIAKDIKRLNK